MDSRINSVLERALGSYLGLAVGDALGATVEFMTAREIAARYQVHKQILGGGWLRLQPGQVTDDTEMALVLGAALIRKNNWDLRAVADAFADWLRGRPADVGNTCRRGIEHYISTGELSVAYSEASAGNGAAMRNLPTVLATLDNEERLMQRSLEQAHITHKHPQSDAAVVVLARITRRLILDGQLAPCEQLANEFVQRHPEFGFRPWPGNSGGYVVETLQTVFDGFFNTNTFEDCLVRVVNRGGDADTTGAIAGQLAGAYYGRAGIPEPWLTKLDPVVTASIHSQTPGLLALAGL